MKQEYHARLLEAVGNMNTTCFDINESLIIQSKKLYDAKYHSQPLNLDFFIQNNLILIEKIIFINDNVRVLMHIVNHHLSN
jgi:hypothetical protein